jgi:serine O-acetyltransferase
MERPFLKLLYEEYQNRPRVPSPRQVVEWVHGALGLLFPDLANHRCGSFREFELHARHLALELNKILDLLDDRIESSADELERAFIARLPEIREKLLKDAHAICHGDPAAVSETEVIRTYPGFWAVAVYRIAHAFYDLGVPLIPRILAEHAHSTTGIDIHPAAEIGEHFCIDHGTGLVIGETVVIGNEVKIYQGVTLGALSVQKDMAQTKRHPTIEDRVVIYSGATILGGDTVIGHDSVIGGNVWITQSIPPHCRIYYTGYERQRAKAKGRV